MRKRVSEIVQCVLWLGIVQGFALLAQGVAAPGIRASLDGHELRLEAVCPADTQCVVWEASTRFDGAFDAVVGVDRPGGSNSVLRLPVSGAQQFLRVRALPAPGFSGRVNRIVRTVRESWPEAILLEASSGFADLVQTYPDPAALRVVLSVNDGTVVVDESDWNGLVAPMFNPLPWMGSARLPWPVAMDELEAEAVFRQAGYGAAFGAVTLRQPVYPGMTEPYFIFRTADGRFVFVGTLSRTVKAG